VCHTLKASQVLIILSYVYIFREKGGDRPSSKVFTLKPNGGGMNGASNASECKVYMDTLHCTKWIMFHNCW
jgi:hypothetical protein